jgi:hypothetical protein
MTQITIRLQRHEVQSAALVGFRRQLLASLRNDTPSFPERYPGQLWYNHIAGACAECAVARHLGVYWDMSVDTFNTTDLPGWNCEIRFSPAGKPKVKPRDTRRIIAVTGEPGNISAYTILGWLPAKEAMRPEWESTDLPTCWFPPPDAWRDISTILPEYPDA